MNGKTGAWLGIMGGDPFVEGRADALAEQWADLAGAKGDHVARLHALLDVAEHRRLVNVEFDVPTAASLAAELGEELAADGPDAVLSQEVEGDDAVTDPS